MLKTIHVILAAAAFCSCQAWAAEKLALKDLSRYVGVWKTESTGENGKPQLSCDENQILADWSVMQQLHLDLDPNSREVVRSYVAWLSLCPSGEQFAGLAFSSDGWIAEAVTVPKNGGFISQVSLALTNGSHETITAVDDFLSDTEIRSTWRNVIMGSKFSEQGRATTAKKTNRSSLKELVENKELVVGKWHDVQPPGQLAPLKRLLGNWQVKDSTGKEAWNCLFSYRGGNKWLVERWKFTNGDAGLNITGIDPSTGDLALWGIAQGFMGKLGRWDELDGNSLGQVQGNQRLIREFPDAKTFNARWEQLSKGSFVDAPGRFSAKLVDESK